MNRQLKALIWTCAEVKREIEPADLKKPMDPAKGMKPTFFEYVRSMTVKAIDAVLPRR